jgi:hypothetical protein
MSSPSRYSTRWWFARHCVERGAHRLINGLTGAAMLYGKQHGLRMAIATRKPRALRQRVTSR